MANTRSFASETENKHVIIRMSEMADGEYECKSWEETETKYGKTYLVSIINKGINQMYKVYANSFLKKIVDTATEPFKITMKNGYIDNKNRVDSIKSLPDGVYTSTEWNKITIKSENRETYIITLDNGPKIWANNYLNTILKDNNIIQIKFAIVSGKMNGFKAKRNTE